MEQVEIEYIPEQMQFKGVVDDEFRRVQQKESAVSEDFGNSEPTTALIADAVTSYEPDEEGKDAGGVISNRRKKRTRRMKIADLKKLSSRPDIVEVWDVASADPKLLVFLKSYRNTVPVLRHWCQKRRFSRGKRGVEKQPFKLPDFIAATGVENIRRACLAQNQGSRKMDIGYRVVYDALFRYQTKPKLTSCGDVYYEGKEFEVDCSEIKRGSVSRKLREALGLAHADDFGRTVRGRQEEPPTYEGEQIDKSKHWGDLQEIEEKEAKLAHEPTAKRVYLLRTKKTDSVKVSLQPDELEVLANVLPAKYEKAREEEKLHNKRDDLSDTVADFEKKRKQKMQDKDSNSKKEFRF